MKIKKVMLREMLFNQITIMNALRNIPMYEEKDTRDMLENRLAHTYDLLKKDEESSE